MNKLINRVYLYRRALDDISNVTLTIQCEVDRLAESDLARLHEVWPVPLDEMKRRLGLGDQCFVALTEGRVAHYSWVQFSGAHEIRDAGCRVEVQRGHVWVYHCRTADWARGRGIYPFVLTQILAECKSQNTQAAWIYTGSENIASQNGIVKAGFAFHQELSALKMFGRVIPLTVLDRGLLG